MAEFSAMTSLGTTVLYSTFAIMGGSSLFFLQKLLTTSQPDTLDSPKLKNYLTFFVVLIASMAYYGMATKEGGLVQSVKPEEPGRFILWARYVDWSLTTPLLLLDLATLVQLPFFKIVRLVSVDLLMIITGLFAALAGIESKWGWFTFSMAFFFGVLYDLLTSGTEAAAEIGGEVESKYKILGYGTVVLWTAYPVVWALAEGLDVISVDQEIIAYAVLDVLAKAVFGFIILSGEMTPGLPESGKKQLAKTEKAAKKTGGRLGGLFGSKTSASLSTSPATLQGSARSRHSLKINAVQSLQAAPRVLQPRRVAPRPMVAMSRPSAAQPMSMRMAI